MFIYIKKIRLWEILSFSLLLVSCTPITCYDEGASLTCASNLRIKDYERLDNDLNKDPFSSLITDLEKRRNIGYCIAKYNDNNEISDECHKAWKQVKSLCFNKKSVIDCFATRELSVIYKSKNTTFRAINILSQSDELLNSCKFQNIADDATPPHFIEEFFIHLSQKNLLEKMLKNKKYKVEKKKTKIEGQEIYIFNGIKYRDNIRLKTPPFIIINTIEGDIKYAILGYKFIYKTTCVNNYIKKHILPLNPLNRKNNIYIYENDKLEITNEIGMENHENEMSHPIYFNIITFFKKGDYADIRFIKIPMNFTKIPIVNTQ